MRFLCDGRQMLQETLPLRKRQLYNMYGPGGSPALIPAEQATVVIRPGASGGTGDEAFLELLNPLVRPLSNSIWEALLGQQVTRSSWRTSILWGAPLQFSFNSIWDAALRPEVTRSSWSSSVLLCAPFTIPFSIRYGKLSLMSK